MSYKLRFGDFIKSSKLKVLSVEIVLMSCDFTPISTGLIREFDVLLSKNGLDCPLHCIEFFIIHCFNFFSGLDQKDINAIGQIFRRVLRRLNAERIVNYIFDVSCSAEDNVSKLLLGSEICVKWLIKILHHNLINQIIMIVIFDGSYFIETHIE